MSSRKRKYGVNVTIEEEIHELLVKLAQRRKKSNKDILARLIIMDDQFDLGNSEWEERLNAVLLRADKALQLNKYEGLDNAPQCLVWAFGRWICIKERKGKGPQLTKFPKELDEALALCAECERQKAERLEQEQLKETIANQGKKILDLTNMRNQKIIVHQCNNGGRITRNGTSFSGCPKIGKPGALQPVMNCEHYYPDGRACPGLGKVEIIPEIESTAENPDLEKMR